MFRMVLELPDKMPAKADLDKCGIGFLKNFRVQGNTNKKEDINNFILAIWTCLVD
jgi:hypothetical protein